MITRGNYFDARSPVLTVFSDVSYPQYQVRQRGGRRRCLALPDRPHHCVHIGEGPDLGELAVFDAIKSELRNSHPTTGGLNSLEGPRWVPVTVRCTAIFSPSTTMCRISQCQSGNAEIRGTNCAVTAADANHK
jgi:hypothetical protein